MITEPLFDEVLDLVLAWVVKGESGYSLPVLSGELLAKLQARVKARTEARAEFASVPTAPLTGLFGLFQFSINGNDCRLILGAHTAAEIEATLSLIDDRLNLDTCKLRKCNLLPILENQHLETVN